MLVGVVFAALLTVGGFGQGVVVRVASLSPIVETRVASPGPGYEWAAGYHRWDGVLMHGFQDYGNCHHVQPPMTKVPLH